MKEGTNMANKPNVIVEVKCGAVVGVCADRAVNVYVVDHDRDGVGDEDLVDFPVSKGHIEKVKLDGFAPADRSRGFVQAALKKMGV
jgi:hypothetical protein